MNKRIGTRIAFGAVLLCRVASAQNGEGAREHFAHGVEFAQRHEFEAAANDFEAAYRLSPNYVVLYNLGQTYFAVGKFAEALARFESYLEKGGARVPPARRAEVQALIVSCKQSVGFASIEVDVNGAEVWVDGISVGTAPLRSPVTLLKGSHGLTVTQQNAPTFVEPFEVQAQETRTLKVHLERSVAVAPPPPVARTGTLGQLLIDTPMPSVEVSLDGSAQRRFVNEPLLVTVGPHRVTCARSGYESAEIQTEITPQRVSSVTCNLQPVPNLPAAESGIVSLTINESSAEVRIDGRRSRNTERLPSGSHLVRVHRLGYVDWTRTIVLRPGFPVNIEVRLRPTAERSAELARSSSIRRTWAYVIGGSGLALLGTGVTLYATNSQRYSRWTSDRDALSRDIKATQTAGPALDERASSVRGTAVSIQRQDDIAIAASAVGGALLTYAVVSWLGSE